MEQREFKSSRKISPLKYTSDEDAALESIFNQIAKDCTELKKDYLPSPSYSVHQNQLLTAWTDLCYLLRNSSDLYRPISKPGDPVEGNPVRHHQNHIDDEFFSVVEIGAASELALKTESDEDVRSVMKLLDKFPMAAVMVRRYCGVLAGSVEIDRGVLRNMEILGKKVSSQRRRKGKAKGGKKTMSWRVPLAAGILECLEAHGPKCTAAREGVWARTFSEFDSYLGKKHGQASGTTSGAFLILFKQTRDFIKRTNDVEQLCLKRVEEDERRFVELVSDA